MSLPTVKLLRSLDPATGAIVGEVPETSPDAIPGMVARARAAQSSWAALSHAERGVRLIEAGALLAAAADDIALLMTREMGKPLKESLSEVRHCAEGMPVLVREIQEALAPEIKNGERVRSTIYHDPFGVCAAISPWNFPVAMPHEMVLPALMAGNAVILKPSEETPLSGHAYVNALNRALPKDVLQVVHGTEIQGKALVASDVDLIVFTGSREAGKNILGAAAPGLKRVILELGGKDPLVVLDDADLEAAARFAVHNSFRNAGQVCVSTERIYVDEKVAPRFEELVAGLTRKLRVGAGTEPDVEIGPMIHGRQKAFVLRQVEEARTQGARVVAGGDERPGNFVTPTVLADVTHDMSIMTQETFGPVACLARFRTLDEAVNLANDTPYGLGAVVFGRDETRALSVARRLTAGMIGVNKSCSGADGTPWVGAKESGFGFHSSRDGHRQFAQTRVVSMPR